MLACELTSSASLVLRWRLQESGSAEHTAALAAVHRACAEQLLHLCQRNGGVYIKAAQLASTIQSVPKEYRECAPVQ